MEAGSFSLGKAVAKRNAPVRRSTSELDSLVLEILARSNRPISAYDIASRSIAAGQPIVPNQVYRTLARLMEQGSVHRVECLSAYMLKQHSVDGCLICDQCHAVQILSDPKLIARLRDWANRFGFTAARTVVEMHGHCPDCAKLNHSAHENMPGRVSPPSSALPF